MSTQAVHRLSAGADTLTKLLGPLEVEVMQIIWRAPGPVLVRQVREAILVQRAHTIVMTMMMRLAEKGLLRRDGAGRGTKIAYLPTVSEQAFVAARLADLLGAVARDYPAVLPDAPIQ
jgi:predicted transcriptional regulator